MADLSKRKAHVKRIFPEGEEGGPTFFDVMRFDRLPIQFRSLPDGRTNVVVKFIFHWQDEVDENVPTKRKTKQIDVKTEDDTLVGSLWSIERIPINTAGLLSTREDGVQGQAVNFIFKNNLFGSDVGVNHSRKATVVKVVGNDLGGLDMSNGRLVDWDTYRQALQDGTKSENQILDVAVTDVFKVLFSASDTDGVAAQAYGFVLKNKDDVEALFDLGNPDAVDKEGKSLVVSCDPLQVIVNVGGGARTVLTVVYMGAAPQWHLEFTTPKTFYGQSELAKTDNPILPAFGSPVDVATDTMSFNQTVTTVPYGVEVLVITGNVLVWSVYEISTDWRGYTTLTTYTLGTAGSSDPAFTGVLFIFTDVSTAKKKYFDYKGKQIDKIPPDKTPPTGLALISDDEGTVRVSSKKGLAKYDKNGGVLWRAKNGDIPETASWDSTNRRIVAVFQGSGSLTLEHYDLTGARIKTVDLNPDGYSQIADVSRKGKTYVTHVSPDMVLFDYPEIWGYNTEGEKIFTIPDMGRESGDLFFTGAAAFGENYIVVGVTADIETAENIIGDIGFGDEVIGVFRTSTQPAKLRVYNAESGAQVSERDFGAFTDSNRTTGIFQDQNISTYNKIGSYSRNAYFP